MFINKVFIFMEKVKIDNVELVLTNPDNITTKWTGQEDLVRQITASWHIISEDDIPLNYIILLCC